MCRLPVAQVREQDLSKVIHTLAQEFDIYREVGGEPVPVARADSSNGFPRAQHGEGRPLTPKPGRGLLFPLRPFPCAGGSVGMGRPADTASQDGEMGRGKLQWVLVEHDPAFSPGPTRGRPSPRLPFHLSLPGPSLAGPSPTVHPIQSPQNRFCVLTLDPETLPAIATTLIDVLFYSHRWVLCALHPCVLTPLFPLLCPTTFHLSLDSAALCPVLSRGSWQPVMPMCPSLVFKEGPDTTARVLSCSVDRAVPWSGRLALGSCTFGTDRVHHSLPSIPGTKGDQGPQTGGKVTQRWEGLPRATCASSCPGLWRLTGRRWSGLGAQKST